MVVVIVSDSPKAERKKIVESVKDHAAYYTDEQWECIESGTAAELEAALESTDRLDMACLDVTIDGNLQLAEQVRRDFSESYLMLVADQSISPVKYIRPTIQAESLMLKPLDKLQLKEVIGEAVSNYARRLQEPQDNRVFVVESGGERDLIEYDKILFFESREKKVFLSTEREEYGFYNTLDELEKSLKEGFIRCHRSYIVNKKRIAKVEISGSRVILDDGTELPLSRSFKPVIKEYLKENKLYGNY